jgi:hypothetical protein
VGAAKAPPGRGGRALGSLGREAFSPRMIERPGVPSRAPVTLPG